MKSTLIGVLVLVAVVVCYLRGVFNPPISITFRKSLLSGYVLQVRSLSDKPIKCIMSVYNNKSGQKCENVGFIVQPGGMQELGTLEINWVFEPGEYGWVKVDGHLMKLHFSLYNKGDSWIW